MGVIRLTGTLRCAPEEVAALRAALLEHIRLSRAEPGCLTFEMSEPAPCLFALSESFIDQAAFDAHQARTRASDWWRISQHLPRDFTLIEE